VTSRVFRSDGEVSSFFSNIDGYPRSLIESHLKLDGFDTIFCRRCLISGDSQLISGCLRALLCGLGTSIRLLETQEEQDRWLAENRETINAKIRRGIEQLDRGQGIPEDRIDAYLADLKAMPE
jgi:hypothetical protein